MKVSVSFVLGAFLLFACCASAAQYAFSMTYTLTNSAKHQNGGYITGTAYYRYDTANAKAMRVYYNNKVFASASSSANIIELENYERPRLFKKCGSTCEVLPLNRAIEPWYYQNGDTKTSTTSAEGYTRYTRSQKNGYSIKALWLKSTGAPSAQYLQKLEFADGTVLTFNPSSYTARSFTDSVFDDNSGAKCVTDTCKPYMDVVFVFDESGSIDNNEFEKMKNFARSVSKSFEQSDASAYIGLVTFSGNIDWTENGCDKKKCKYNKFKDPDGTSYGRCNCDYKNVSRSPNYPITRKLMTLTRVNVDSKLAGLKRQGHNTCQGAGFLSAWELMLAENPRTKMGLNRPYSVAIGVTDGDDACPNITQNNAQLIKKNLGGTIIEVGIGMWTKYDKDFLRRVASTVNGQPAYYDVTNFDGLAGFVKSISTAVCTSSYSSVTSCKAGCKGYCGCNSKCYCPSCPGSGTKCATRGCSISSDTTEGCKDTAVNCVQSDKCYTYGCNKDTGCTKQAKNCNSGLAKCQVGSCSPSSGCLADNRDSLCPAKACHTAKCAPSDPKKDGNGCVYTNTCIGPSPTTSGGCIKYDCTSGKCVTTDTCLTKNTKCTTWKCDTKQNKCVVATNKTCTDAACQHHSSCDPATGNCVAQTKDDTYCKSVLAKAHPSMSFTCSKAICNPNQPKDEHCELQSLGDNCEICGASGHKSNAICQKEADQQSKPTASPGYCYSGSCYGYRNADQSAASKCVFTKNSCTPPDACHTASCTADGQCKYTANNQVTADKCHKVVCNEKTHKYELAYTGCGRPNAKCQEEHCDGNTGSCTYSKLYSEYNCTNAICDPATGAVTYVPRVCDAKNRCFSATCNVATNACEETRLENDVACKNNNKCKDAVCNEDTGKCTITDRVHFNEEGDQCIKYLCVPENGTWYAAGSKCDDGRLCTVDLCDYNGTCSYADRICDMNMTGYGECFISACSENRKNGCYRKIVENSYFDECGNCISAYRGDIEDPSAKNSTECKKALSWEEKAAAISAGVAAGIIIACVIGALGVSVAGTLLTRELIRRAKAAADSGAVSNPIYEDNGRELSNPAFEGNDA